MLITAPAPSTARRAQRFTHALVATAFLAAVSVSSPVCADDDEDNDGLPDRWERSGVDFNNDGVVDVDLPSMGANPRRKDIFIELDFMVFDANGDGDATDPGEHTHRPTDAAIQAFVDMFATAPVTNPDGSLGITAHIDTGTLGGGNSIPHFFEVDFSGQTHGHRRKPSVAVNDAGDRPVVVWEDDRDRNGKHEIFFQRLAAGGVLRGDERAANSNSSGEQRAPAVDVDANGNFVVVWEDDQDGNGKYQILARGFSNGGAQSFADMTVNSVDDGQQLKPAIAMDAAGNFVVVWEDDQDGNGKYQILARGFNADGTPRFADITVNSVDDGQQLKPVIAMDGTGNFVVAWEDDQDGNGKYQILARGFNANGTQRFADITVNSVDDGQQLKPALAMDAAGRFVVAWQDDQDGNGKYEILARGFNANGTQRFADFTVNAVSSGQQRQPAVGMDSASGNFTVSWEDDQDGNGRYEILARGFNADRTQRFAQRTVNTVSTRDQLDPTVAMDANGAALIAWHDDRDANGYYELFARGFDTTGADAPGEFRAHGRGTNNTFYSIKANNFSPARAMVFHYGLFVHRRIDTGSSGIAEVSGNDLIVSLGNNNTDARQANTLAHEYGHNLNLRHGGNESKNNKPNYNSVLNYSYQFPGIDSNCDATGDGVLNFSLGLRPPLVETSLDEVAGMCNGFLLVNTQSSGQQIRPQVASDAAGNFVVVWQDDQDENGYYQILARGFDATGAQRFADITVNSVSDGQQRQPVIAMDAAGRFVVAWEDDQDENGKYQILARGFNADGTARIADFTVNSVAAGQQLDPSIAMDGTGRFVVTWQDDQDGNGYYQILARGFNADGTQRFADITVNSVDDGQQLRPDVAMRDNARFVVVWQDDQDGNGKYQILARGFNANGTQRFADMTVNSVDDGQQLNPAIGMDATGRFVVVWEDDQDGNGKYQIFARGFTADGAQRFGDMTVNAVAAGQQLLPDVTLDAQARFLVVFQDDQDGNGAYQILGRSFTAAGAQLAAQFTVNLVSSGQQLRPAVANDGAGNAVIVWEDDQDSNDYYEIHARLLDFMGAARNAVSIDWNGDGAFATGVSQDINADNARNTLRDYDDWEHIKLRGWSSGND